MYILGWDSFRRDSWKSCWSSTPPWGWLWLKPVSQMKFSACLIRSDSHFCPILPETLGRIWSRDLLVYFSWRSLGCLVKDPPPPQLQKNTSWYKFTYNARPFLTKTKSFELNIFQTSSTWMKFFFYYIRCWINWDFLICNLRGGGWRLLGAYKLD